MTARPRALVSWSSGKDSAWALETARREGRLEVVGLLTTVTAGYGRVAMHGVRESVLDLQAAAAGLPCVKVTIPPGCVNAEYERALAEALAAARSRGVERIVFGDLFLEDVRRYREERLAAAGIRPEFPLWGRDTAELAREMIREGVDARIVCLDPARVPEDLAGAPFDAALLARLPAGADPCGENGEFHTCVAAGPMFRERLCLEPGAVVRREGFVFADLVPAPVPVPAAS